MITPDYVLSSDKETRRLVFLLHGYGANGADLLEIGHFWAPSLPLTTFISPNAPQQWEIGPFGYQWFGLKDFDPFNAHQGNVRQGLDQAGPRLKAFIEAEMKRYGLTSNQVVLVGFSQGAMLALEMVFYIPGLAGIIGYSGAFYKPSQITFKGPYPPILLVHGMLDTVVPYVSMSIAEKELKKIGCRVETETGAGLGHTMDVQGLHRGLDFIQQIFTQNSPIIVMTHNNKNAGA